MRSRQNGIRRAGFQGDLPVAVAIHPAFQNVARQHLHLPDFARPSPHGPRRINIAPRRQGNRGQNLRLEHLGSAAVMGQRQQRVAGVEIALHLAKIGLERPEGQNDPARHAVCPGRRVKGRVVFLRITRRPGNAPLADQALRELKEGLAEDALTMVSLDHRAIASGARHESVNRALRQTLGRRLRRHGAQKTAEIAATWGRGHRAGGQTGKQGNR